jgi:hypothetical protein
MKKLILFLFAISFLVGCNQYKSFEEEISDINNQYDMELQKAAAKDQIELVEKYHKKYDKNFKKAVANWNKSDEEEKYYKTMEESIIEVRNIQMESEYKELFQRYASQLRMAMDNNDNYLANQIGEKIGYEYVMIASKYGIPFNRINTSNIMSRAIAAAYPKSK